MAAFAAAQYLTRSNKPKRWIVLTRSDTLLNLLSLKEALASLDPAEPHAVASALRCDSRRLHASSGGAARTCGPCHQGNSGSPADCAAISASGVVAMSWSLLTSCQPLTDPTAVGAIMRTALLLGGQHGAAPAGSRGHAQQQQQQQRGEGPAPPPHDTNSVAAGLHALSRVLWLFGVPVTPAWGAGAAAVGARAGAGRGVGPSGAHGYSAHAHEGAAAGQAPWDLAILVEAAAGGGVPAAVALYHSIATPAPPSFTAPAQQLPRLYEALWAVWGQVTEAAAAAAAASVEAEPDDSKAAGAGPAEQLCPQEPLQPGERWEEGVLIVHVDTRPPKAPSRYTFVVNKEYAQPDYPPWPDFEAGKQFGAVYLSDNKHSGFVNTPGRFIYTRDPRQNAYSTGTAAMNSLAAEGLGMRFRRVSWPAPSSVYPAERHFTWIKVDFMMKALQYALYEQCGGTAPHSNASQLGAEHRALLQQLLPPSGLRLLVFIDSDAHIRDPVSFRAKLDAFLRDSQALVAFSEEPNQAAAYKNVVQFINTGFQVIKPTIEVLHYYEEVWLAPYKYQQSDKMLISFPFEQGWQNLLIYDPAGPRLLENNTWRLPFADWNTPAGRIVRHAWGIRDKWWPILTEDMANMNVWHYFQVHGPKPAAPPAPPPP